jgi:hypothetical protein
MKLIVRILIMTMAITVSNSCLSFARDTTSACAEFLADKRMNWSTREDSHRLPPNIYGPNANLLAQPYMRQLPKGLSSPQAEAFFHGVFVLLRDRARVFQIINDIKVDLELTTLERLFSKYEVRYSLNIIRVDDILSTRTWLNYIKRGFIVVDSIQQPLYTPSLDDRTRAAAGHWHHASLAHRTQMHMILRELEAHPELFGGPYTTSQILALYKSLGSSNAGSNLDWSDTGLNPKSGATFYQELFDTLENNASSPGFFYEYREYWPWLRI